MTMPEGLRLANEDIRLASEGLRIAVLLNRVCRYKKIILTASPRYHQYLTPWGGPNGKSLEGDPRETTGET